MFRLEPWSLKRFPAGVGSAISLSLLWPYLQLSMSAQTFEFTFYIFQDEFVARYFLLPSSYLRIVEFMLIQVCERSMICEDDEGTTTQEVIEFGDGSFYCICLAFSCWLVALCRVKGVWGHCYYFLLAVFYSLAWEWPHMRYRWRRWWG